MLLNQYIKYSATAVLTNDQLKRSGNISLNKEGKVDLLTKSSVVKFPLLRLIYTIYGSTGFSPCAEFSGYDVVLLNWMP